MKKIVIICIALFWAVMTFLLIRNEAFSSRLQVSEYSDSTKIKLPEGVTENWMGIYLNNVKIGYTSTFLQQLDKDGLKGYTIRNTTDLKIPVLGENRNVYIEGLAYITQEKKIKNFLFFFTSDKHKIELKGRNDGDFLVVEISGSGDMASDSTIKLDNDALLLNFIGTPLIMDHLSVGRELKTKVFDPMTLNPGYANTRVVRTEKIEYLGQKISVFVVEHEFKGVISTSWIGEDGMVYREETAYGFVMRKEYRDEAVVMESSPVLKADILDEFSVKSSSDIKDPKNTVYLKARLHGLDMEDFDLGDGRQIILNARKNIVEIKAVLEKNVERVSLDDLRQAADRHQYLKSDFLVQSDDPRIIKTAREIIGDEKDAWQSVKLLNQWVYTNISKVPVISIPSAVDVLATREGDCNEHTALFTALSRSIGVPTRINAGIVFNRGRFYYHAWPSVYIGRWISIDPTFGQSIADATHIKLLEGNLERQIDIIKILGKIEVEVLEYR